MEKLMQLSFNDSAHLSKAPINKDGFDCSPCGNCDCPCPSGDDGDCNCQCT